MECIIKKVSKSHRLQKSRPRGGEWVGFCICFFYIHVACGTFYLGFKGLLDIFMNVMLKQNLLFLLNKQCLNIGINMWNWTNIYSMTLRKLNSPLKIRGGGGGTYI